MLVYRKLIYSHEELVSWNCIMFNYLPSISNITGLLLLFQHSNLPSCWPNMFIFMVGWLASFLPLNSQTCPWLHYTNFTLNQKMGKWGQMDNNSCIIWSVLWCHCTWHTMQFIKTGLNKNAEFGQWIPHSEVWHNNYEHVEAASRSH